MEMGLSIHVSYSLEPAWCWYMEESPNAQDWQISRVWQAIFSPDPKTDRLLPVSALLAGGCRLGWDAGPPQPPTHDVAVSEPAHAAGHRRLSQDGGLGC